LFEAACGLLSSSAKLELGGGGELFPAPADGGEQGAGSQKETFFPSIVTQSILHRVAERRGVAPVLSSSSVTRERIGMETARISRCRRRQGYVGAHWQCDRNSTVPGLSPGCYKPSWPLWAP